MTWKNQLAPLSHFLSPALSMAPNLMYVFIRLVFFCLPHLRLVPKTRKTLYFLNHLCTSRFPFSALKSEPILCADREINSFGRAPGQMGIGGVSDKVNPVALESVYLIDSRGVRRDSPRAARSTHKSQISPEWCIPSWNPSTGGQISCYWYTDCASSQNIAPVCFLSNL